jgi:hypothetical protein
MIFSKSLIRDIVMAIFLSLFSIFINRTITFEVHSLGESMQMYANNFPSTENVLQPQRFLLPLLSNILNIDIQVLNLLFLFFFLFLITTFLNIKTTYLNSLLISLSLCSTMVVQFHLNFGGYPDILSYVLLLLVFFTKERKLFPYLLFFLGLLTKETVVFTALFFLSLKEISKLKFLLSISFYLPFYFSLSNGTYDINHYLEPLAGDFFYWINQSKEYLVLGYFSSIKFLWILIFSMFFLGKKKMIPVYLLIFGISLQFIFGGDSTRFISFIFLGIMFIIGNFDLKKFQSVNFIILILNIITVKYYVFAYGNLLKVNESKLSFLDIYDYIEFIKSGI